MFQCSRRAGRISLWALSSTCELAFGFSPCPNDTFAFWAAVSGALGPRDVRLKIGAIADIESLNQRAVLGKGERLSVTKLSLPALAAVTDDYAVLSAGAALGFGCGPLVVGRGDAPEIASLEDLRGRRIATPGRNTTARLLFQIFAPEQCELVDTGFDQVMPMVAAGECDAGLIIHECRFTYPQLGLVELADLGQLWEERFGLPLPLGVIAMQREFGRALFDEVADILRESVEHARQCPEAPRAFVREHAQELDDAVCDQHIGLYVNDFSVELGEAGRGAIDALLQTGRQAGLLPEGAGPWWRSR